MKGLRRFGVTAATMAALTAGGYQVGRWDDSRGLPVVDGANQDTVWLRDTVELVRFVDQGNFDYGAMK